MSSSATSHDRRRFIAAAEYGLLEEVIELSSKFSNDEEELSEALILACCRGYHGCLNVVKWLVEHTAADVNYESVRTPLTAACEYEHLDIVKYLVETCHADVNLPDSMSFTSLTLACVRVNMSVSIYLLCEVSDLNANITDREGNTAMHRAVWCRKNDGNTQLHKACGDKYDMYHNRGDLTQVRRLVMYVRGHKINVQDNTGNTPLHIACFAGYCDIVETLMLAGADETITNNMEKTPAQAAESV